MKKSFTLNKKILSTLPIPEKGKRAYYYDTKIRNLVVCITSSGHQSFQVYRKIKGKPERITLGTAADLSIDQARFLADEVNGKLTTGINPNELKRNERLEKTLCDLFEYYLEHHAKLHKKTWNEDEAQFKRYLSKWKNRKLSDFEKQDIQRLHSHTGEEHGHYAANRLLAFIHTLFNKGIDWGFCEKNPAHRIQKFKEKSRERFLQADELPRFFQALAEEKNTTVRDYILISLLTGARKGNVQTMRWEQINFTNETWTIPVTKNGLPHTVPLVPQAVKILKDRKLESTSDFVFPGTGKAGYLMDPKKVWAHVLERAEIKDLRLHDLRRSLGSWQASQGASLSIIGKSLAHKNVSTTAIYARLNLDPVRESMNKATEAMLKAGKI